MPLSSNNIITATTISTAKLLTTLLPFPNMSTNYLPENPSQAWTWETAMDPHHHHHFLVPQEEEQGNGNEREHMFEKPLTPSDVGKLNRLVIPKQHAEKYFPLPGESGGEKGLLLSFEDDSGKAWHFRYSYWTSSQSYVLTKGWSRFVKEKRLLAGDIVLFQRRRRDNLLYIECRRRGDTHNTEFPSHSSTTLSPALYTTSPSPSCFNINPVQQDCHIHAGRQMGSASNSTATTKPVNSRRLRLFGVNLDCEPEL